MRSPNKAWVYIAILTLITAFAWLAITVKNSFTKPTLPASIESLTRPLDPNLDITTLKSLSDRARHL